MTRTQLRSLVAVFEAGSVAGAAHRLVVSAAAVSAAVASLEREVGVKLLERVGRGVRLTPAGEVLVDYARRIEGLEEEALVRVHELADAAGGVLRIGAVATVGEELLPRWLSVFRSARPKASVHLEVANKARLLERLRTHRLDLVIAGRPGHEAGLRIVATRPHELLLCAAAGWAREWFGPSLEVTPETASAVTWLVREEGSGTRASAEEVLSALDIHPPSLTIGSNLAIKRGWSSVSASPSCRAISLHENVSRARSSRSRWGRCRRSGVGAWWWAPRGPQSRSAPSSPSSRRWGSSKSPPALT